MTSQYPIKDKFAHPVNFSSLIFKILMFSLAISYSTTSSLPWFMDLTFQGPMQSDFKFTNRLSTAECYSHFGPAAVFSLERLVSALYSPPVAYWTPSNLGSSSFGVISFCLFIQFMGCSRKNTRVISHSLLQWSPFCQNSSLWPVHLGWPCTAWLIASLSCASPVCHNKAVIHEGEG